MCAATTRARPSAHWACYHTRMWEWTAGGIHYGIVGHAVGSSFSVLVAEQLFASGCRLLLSVASAGQITDIAPPPYHILIARALRDEGTSYHYLPATTFAEADPALIAIAAEGLVQAGCSFHIGDTWTTDAPFRETADSIAARRDAGILAVEMEAAALYAFGCGVQAPGDLPRACLKPARLCRGRFRERSWQRRAQFHRTGERPSPRLGSPPPSWLAV